MKTSNQLYIAPRRVCREHLLAPPPEGLWLIQIWHRHYLDDYYFTCIMKLIMIRNKMFYDINFLKFLNTQLVKTCIEYILLYNIFTANQFIIFTGQYKYTVTIFEK